MARTTSDLLDYIKKYGDYDFSTRKFCPVDALVLQQIVYMKFDLVIPPRLKKSSAKPSTQCAVKSESSMSLRDIAAHPDIESVFSDPIYGKIYRKIFDALCDSRRFGSIQALSFVNHVDMQAEHQFCGMVLALPKGAPASIFVSFRGTDENIVGWKEDFNMAYLLKIPSQLHAIEFLRYAASLSSGRIIVAGHSKGGNLAIYSCACAPRQIQDRIRQIYCFDSPGFLPSFYRNTNYYRIDDKIMKFIPEQSLIGLLFSTKHACITVQSYAKGIAQHDPLSWKIRDGKFAAQAGIARIAYRRAQKVNHWMQKMTCKERENFINFTYELFLTTQTGTVYEIRKHPILFVSNAFQKFSHWERKKKLQYHKSLRKLWR